MAAAAYKVLAQAAPATTAETTLYVTPPGTQTICSTITIANISAVVAGGVTSIDVTVRVRPGGAAAADRHILVPAVTIAPRRTETASLGLTLSAGDVVSVQTSVAGKLAAHLYGVELA